MSTETFEEMLVRLAPRIASEKAARAVTPESAAPEAVLALANAMLTKEAAAALAESMRPGNSLAVLDRAALQRLPKPKAIVEGLLYESTVATFAANGGIGKTAIALDVALCMGTRRRFLGRHVAQGRVLFIAAEGINAFNSRIEAWEQSRGIPVGSASSNIEFVQGVTMNPATLRELGRMHEASRYSLIVFDTSAALFNLANENDNAEVSRLYGHLKRIRDLMPGTCVLVLAHTTEQVDARGRRTSKHRGASSFRNDSDTLIVGSGNGDDFQISTRTSHGGKQRDAAETLILGLHLMPVGPHVVVSDQGEKDVDHTERLAREFVKRLDPDLEYSSTSLRLAGGFTSKGSYEFARTKAIELGLIAKTGPSNKAPYRVTETETGPLTAAA